ncbi:Kappa-carrageenase precursor [uncultured Ruminococcus sp.]|nr:CHAP domain-containing protein [uncultured Ruminococcus sp.]SCI18647.1 Kappa-carrageenase precursor [uncultured Ruminococcus sp.]SCJ36316.1 Kappa-carrageenase precursor [uncultured Ruminococcus sp.]
MKKRIASLFTSLLMIVSLMVVMPTMSVSAAGFVPRTSAPTSDNSYYYGLNPFYKSGYGMPNCTAYAYGRAYEILGSKPNLSTGNAGKWWWQNKTDGAYKYGNTPRLGAVACWDKYDQNQGHVAVVEAIDGSSVTISESHYKSTFFDTRTINSDSSNYLTSMRFLGYIYLGDYSVSIPGKSAINVKTGTSYKCTTFNWTASSNTKVYSIKIHKNGTLFKENTTAATSWSVILPVGDYEAYVDSCNDSGYTCSNTVKFTIEKGNPVPSSTTVSASAGTNYTPTSISWLKTANTNEYDVKIWRGTAQKGEAYKILWGEKGTSCLVDLPAGYYEAYVDSRNDYECSMSANIVKFTVTDGNYLDIGDDFYASLLIYKNWLNVTNENGSITVQKSENASARQIWFFDRQSDGSYTIKNCADGSYLDSCSPNGGLAQSKKYSGSNTQKWYIFGRWSGEYYFKPKSVNIVLDVKGNITTGDKVQVCGLNYRDSQKFAIYKLDSYILPSKINLNSGSATIEAGTTKSLTATILPTNSTNKTIIWSTSDASIATVSGGTVTGKKAGTVTITAKTTNGLTANAQIKVVSGHTFGTWTTTKNATCTQVGTKSRKCTVCGKTETQTIAKTGHKSVTDKAIPATCTTDGKTEGSHCSVCGAVIKAQDTIKATGHKFGNWTTTKSATCTESGTQIRKCENCGATESKSLSAKGHTEVVDKAIPATCTTDGKTEGSHCSVCGAVIKAQYTIKATGHKFGNWTTIKPAICTESGTQIRKCENCGATESKSLSAKGHTEVVDKAIPATCTTDGKTEGSHCSVCGAVIKAQEIIKATGHKFGNWTTIKPATCTESGTQIRKCENCGATESKSLSAKGHTEVVDKAIPATCTTDGKTEGSHCSVCNTVIKAQTTITATGHKSSGWIVDKAASIGVKGSKHKECTVCKKVLETAEIPALSRISISKASVTLSTSTYAYDGKAKKPGVTVKLNGKTLKNSTDYTVSYSNNTKVGTAKVTIKGKGNYTGSVSKTYSIKNNFKKATVSSISTKAFTGKNITQSITVKYNGKTLKNGTDYTVSYSNNKNIGTATVKVAGKGSYTGTITKTFKINPAKQEIQKLTAKSKAFFVDWAQKGSATGYEIQYATNSKFTSAKKVTITNKNTDTKTISKLSGKKKYYVRVRSYTTVKGTKYYGAWSASKSVTTKK